MSLNTMTDKELSQQKMQAEIVKLREEIRELKIKNKQSNTKFDVEIAKMIEDTKKTTQERWWYPLVISTGFVVGIITLTKLFL